LFSSPGTDLKSDSIGDSFIQSKIRSWLSIQRTLAKKVVHEDCFVKPPKYVAGVDVAYHMNRAFSAVAVLSYETFELVESATARSIVEIPYVPSFLAFRELKPMIDVLKRLRTKPDVFLVDAHGIAHPERCGCASHFGVVLDVPTIGVAKSVLIGEVSEFDDKGIGYLKDGEEIIGASIMSKVGCKPILVSIGHKVTLNSAIEIVSKMTRDNRIPEPLRIAHKLSNQIRKEAQR
jgi:deoxyribonuclease V